MLKPLKNQEQDQNSLELGISYVKTLVSMCTSTFLTGPSSKSQPISRNRGKTEATTYCCTTVNRLEILFPAPSPSTEASIEPTGAIQDLTALFRVILG